VISPKIEINFAIPAKTRTRPPMKKIIPGWRKWFLFGILILTVN
jgi:hypothetical protein